MSKWRLVSGVAVMISVAMTGCSREDVSKNGTAAHGGKDVPYEKAAMDDVLFRCGGHSLKKSDAEALIELRLHLQSLRLNRQFDLDRRDMRNRILASLPRTFLDQWLLEDWMRTNSISVRAEDVSAAQRAFLSSAGIRSTNFVGSVKKWPSSVQATATERVMAEASASTAKWTYLQQHPVEVTSNEVDAVLERFARINEMAAATNRLVWIHATNVWRRITGGLSIENAAREYTEDENRPEDGEWGGFVIGDFRDEPVFQRMLKAMKPGDLTPPVEADNGVCVVRLDSIEQLDAEDGGKENRYNLSRVFFRLALQYEIPPWDEAQRVVREAAMLKALKGFRDALRRGVREQYPCGERMFRSARRALRLPGHPVGDETAL